MKRALQWIGAITILVAAIVIVYVVNRLYDDEPVTYADDLAHFKHGSTGGERGWVNQLGFGIPYWIWVALPELFPEYLPDQQPGRGYASFGMVYEDGTDPRFDMPIGMSRRRVMGVDRVYFNCAVCHTGVVEESPDGARQIVLGMPANTFDLGRLVGFIEASGKDWRFRSSRMLPKVELLAELRERDYHGTDADPPDELGWIDRTLFKWIVVSMMRDQLLALLGRLDFMRFDSWGPGRVDTFNSAKPILGFDMSKASQDELVGNVDFPSVWNQRARKGMQLHWDGNNCSVDERNLSAGFGTGATPTTLDRDLLLRTADWLWEKAQPPAFPKTRVDAALAARGAPIYREYCWSCHGDASAPFRKPGDGGEVGTVTPLEKILTDRARLDSYTPLLARAQGSIYAGFPEAGDEACAAYFENVCKPATSDADVDEYRALRKQCYPARFTHFRKTHGYANAPLDGLWLRAPYLHNGSVPNLRQLLEPSERRDTVFYTGYPVYDYDNVGFVGTGADAAARGWRFSVADPGNGNKGHEGAEYGTELGADDKNALLEYLKTF